MKDLFLVMVIVAWQSQYIDIECVGYAPNGILVKIIHQPINFSC